ncbi:Probable Zinc-ribbon domain-containing protein [Lachnospiraceae bacterium XBB2008]|nr:Probable Zinc-ribbon domain-containing protein [Lachnospiraceae bacterium XBB2008]
MLNMWDFEKNNEDPSTVSINSSKRFFWTCKKCGYSRNVSAKAVNRGSGKCPCCDTNKVIFAGVNDVLSKVKDFDKFYDFDNNPEFDIYSAGVDCNSKVNYKCPDCGRTWNTSIKAQVRKLNDGTYEAVGCPHYNTMKRQSDDIPFLIDEPRFMRFFDYEINSIDPRHTKINSNESVALKCNNCGYTWNTSIRSFFRGKMLCKCCELNKTTKSGVNDLLTLVPEAKSYLLPEENPEVDLNNLSIRDKTLVNWHCPVCNNTWSASVASRIEGKHGSYRFRKCQKCHRSEIERITPISDVPWVLKFYDQKRNKKSPSEVSVHSTDPIFFKCKECGFAWKASPKSRYEAKNGACPCCDSGKYVQSGINDVLTLCPDIVSILDIADNPNLDLSTKPANSRNKYVFRCKKCGYIWHDTISNRVRKMKDGTYYLRDCPECSNKQHRQVTYDIQYPALAEMYDENANKRHLSSISSYESNTLLLKWICPTCQEQFESRLQSMIAAQTTSTKGCPYCSHTKLRPGESFGDVHSELLDEYDENNDIDPFSVFPNSKKTVKWVCRNDRSHTWDASFVLRHMGHGKCPICYLAGRDLTIESFAAVYPDYLDMYSDNNERKPSEIFYTSPEWLKWICRECGNEFGNEIKTVINDTENACPFCNSRRLHPEVNSLQALRPDVAKYWLDINTLKVDEVFTTSGYAAWFSCPECGNPINEIISSFVNGNYDCPYCNGRKAMPGKTSFKAKHPDLMKEWDTLANYCLGIDPDNILDTFSKKVWWICPKDSTHHYEMTPSDRLFFQKRHRDPCCYCKGRRRKKSFTYK